MNDTVEIKVPDIGDFKDVEVIEVLVKPGDAVEKETSLITLESDKATMEIPSPAAGVVKELKLKVGDKVSEGTLIMLLEASEPLPLRRRRKAAPAAAVASPAPAKDGAVAAGISPNAVPAAAPAARSGAEMHAEVVVLGAGPGGYTAAFRAADLGKKVVLIERHADAGRGMPQRRLHSVQGAAACGQGDDRGRGDGAARASHSASRRSTSTSCAAGRNAWSAA